MASRSDLPAMGHIAKTAKVATGKKLKVFVQRQKEVKKGMVRAFGVLVGESYYHPEGCGSVLL